MKVGIIIPIRDSFKNGERFNELDKLQKRIWEICIKNNQDYQNFIIYQDDEQLFNKAYLMNIGADIAKNECDYFIFHDVDNLPVGDSNVYCPREYSGVLIGKWDGEILTDKDDHFAGALYFNHDDFWAINGFSNCFYGWGWETTNTPKRLEAKGIPWKRYDGEFVQMTHETRHRFTGNPNWINNVIFYRQIEMALWEGFTDIKYKINKKESWGANSTMYYVKLPPPQYDISKILTIEDVKRMAGSCDEEDYKWIIQTYSK